MPTSTMLLICNLTDDKLKKEMLKIQDLNEAQILDCNRIYKSVKMMKKGLAEAARAAKA